MKSGGQASTAQAQQARSRAQSHSEAKRLKSHKFQSNPVTQLNLGNMAAIGRSGTMKQAASNSSLDIDFTFNTIKDVKKVTWKEQAPWFREIFDGFCWLAYCNNNQL